MPTIQKQSPKQTNAKPVVKVPSELVHEDSRGIVDSIVPVGELPETGIKLLITGTSGTGKTTLACTFPKPLLLIRPEAVEDGHKSIKKVPGVFSPKPLTDADQLISLIEHQQETGTYKTVVLDGVQFYQNLVLKKVLGLKEIPPQLSWGIATQGDWQVVNVEFQDAMRKFLNLAGAGIHTLVTGGERTLGNNGGEEFGEAMSEIMSPKIVVSLTPGSAGWLNFVCDYIVCAFIRRKTREVKVTIGKKTVTRREPTAGVEWCARTTQNELYNAKFRVPKGTPLPEVVVDPTFEKLAKLIEGGG